MCSFPPNHRLILDGFAAAVLKTILPLTPSFAIQPLADAVFVLERKPALHQLRPKSLVLSPRLSTHPISRIVAEMHGHHELLQRLPHFFFNSLTRPGIKRVSIALAAIALIAVCLERVGFQWNSTGPVRIVAEAGGRVRTLYVTTGQHVRTGDLILQFDTDDLLSEGQELETRIHLAETHQDYPRDLTRLYVELQQNRLNLNRLTITSPIDGEIVSFTSARRGDLIAPSATIAEVFPDRPISAIRP